MEVEQRDESDSSKESMGSNSDPSEDNFEEEEVYTKLYGVKDPAHLIESRKEKEL